MAQPQYLYYRFIGLLKRRLDLCPYGGVLLTCSMTAVQFMENFCYEHKTLFSFAKHHETGEPLPEELYQKLCAARTFRAGSMMMRQVN